MLDETSEFFLNLYAGKGLSLITGFYIALAASVALALAFGLLFVLSLKKGQLDDLDTPALRVLTEEMDEHRR